jgi:hypothetical protein
MQYESALISASIRTGSLDPKDIRVLCEHHQMSLSVRPRHLFVDTSINKGSYTSCVSKDDCGSALNRSSSDSRCHCRDGAGSGYSPMMTDWRRRSEQTLCGMVDTWVPETKGCTKTGRWAHPRRARAKPRSGCGTSSFIYELNLINGACPIGTSFIR